MLQIRSISDCLWVVDDQTLDEWIFLPEHENFVARGVCGEDLFYLRAKSGELDLFDFRKRGLVARIALDPVESSLASETVVSRDGSRLFVLDRVKAEARAGILHVIDLAEGRLSHSWTGLPASRRMTVERPDGRLLVYGYWFGEEESGTRAVLVDPETGATEESRLVEKNKSSPPPFRGWGFQSVSPDGRWALRIDHHHVPTHSPAPEGVVGRLFGRKGGEPYYGLVMQLWEAFPLRFVRRITVAWRKVEEMPDAIHIAVKREHPDPLGARRSIWDTIAAASAANDPAPLDPPLPRSAYPAPWRDDDARWNMIIRNVEKLVDDSSIVRGWQPDGDAFWVKTYPYLSCVGIDGTISPRLKLARPEANHSLLAFTPLAGRRARLTLPRGEVVMDGSPTDRPYEPIVIGPAADGWAPSEKSPLRAAEERAKARVTELRADRHRIRIPVAGWNEAGVLEAIGKLAREMVPGVHRRAVDGHLDLSFKVGGKIVSDADFFIRIREDFPAAAPVLRTLIECYASAIKPHQFLFSRGEEGAGLLANAVKTLGLLDASSIPTLQRYGELVDKGHEYFFAGNTVPAMIERHGWTDEILDFVFWVLISNYYNTLQDYRPIWEGWGLREAALRRDPETLARHIIERFGHMLTGQYENAFGAGGLKQLARDLPQPHEPWAERFFAEIDRVQGEASDRGAG